MLKVINRYSVITEQCFYLPEEGVIIEIPPATTVSVTSSKVDSLENSMAMDVTMGVSVLWMITCIKSTGGSDLETDIIISIVTMINIITEY